MNLATAINRLRIKLGDVIEDYEFSDGELESFLTEACNEEGYETVDQVHIEYRALVLLLAYYHACMNMGMKYAPYGKYRTSMDSDRVGIEVDKEKLYDHYLQLAKDSRIEARRIKQDIKIGNIGAETDKDRSYSVNWYEFDYGDEF